MRISSSRVSVICSWVATLAFMAGFMVFIVQPWSWAWASPERRVQALRQPLAQGLQDPQISLTKRKEKRKRRLTPAQREAKTQRRLARLARDQAEYRQWRRDLEAGDTDQERLLDTAIESLWEELFHQPLDIQALVEDDNYEELK